MKQVIIMRNDLGLSLGKMCAQTAHAVVEPKQAVVVVQADRIQLTTALTKAESVGLKTNWVFDAGKTEVPPETLTCGCIGPEEDRIIDKITGHLKLL